MIAGILLAVAGSNLRVPRRLVLIAQAVIGCMIARSIPPTIIGEILRDWPLFLTVVFAVIAASSTLGWLLTRWRVLPGTTAVWGSSPGAATAMMLMAGAYGADIRLVAFMQYLRVLLVAFAATIVARLWTTAGSIPATTISWFPPIHWLSFAETLLLIAFGTFVRASPSHSRGAIAVADRPRHRPAGRRRARDRTAALAARRQLRDRRLEHRPRLQPSDPASRRSIAAACPALDPGADGRLRCTRRHARRGRRHRPADRLSRDQSRTVPIQRRSSRWPVTSTWHS